jgi:hypothetical protein
MIGKTKTVKHEAAEVEVHCEKIATTSCPACATPLGKSHCHSYRFTARIGGTTFHHTMTVGPVDGELIPPTKEQFQKDVDSARAYAAKHAHFHHQVGLIENELD